VSSRSLSRPSGAPIRLILFDIDGTLIRTGGAGVRAWDRAFALEFGIHGAVRDIPLAGRTDSSLVRQCFRQYRIPITDENVERFFDTYVFLLHELLHHTNGGACPGVNSFIEQLESLPHAPVVGLLTGNIRLGAEIKLRHFGLWNYFRVGAFADDHEERGQIAIRARERATALLGKPLRGEEILVVGDTPHDIACARAIQAHVLAVGTGGHSCEELRACAPTWTVNSLRELHARDICLGQNCAEAY
jgi:phosphoglycolate phosphatase